MRKPPYASPSAPAAGQGKRGATGHLGYLLRQASVAFRARIEHALADLEVTLPQFSVLTMIAAYPGASNADLARLTLLTPQTVSFIVGNLKRSGALSSRPHAVHGRIQHLELTEAGAATLSRCKQRVARVEAALCAGLTAKEEEVVRRWLVQVAADGGGVDVA